MKLDYDSPENQTQIKGIPKQTHHRSCLISPTICICRSKNHRKETEVLAYHFLMPKLQSQVLTALPTTHKIKALMKLRSRELSPLNPSSLQSSLVIKQPSSKQDKQPEILIQLPSQQVLQTYKQITLKTRI